GIDAVCGSVRSILASKLVFGDADFIYAAGLYDYLDDEVARCLTALLFSRLRRGGRLLIDNFAPELPDIAYMEACLDWLLISRDEAQVAGLAERIPSDRVAKAALFRDEPGNLVFLELTSNGN